MKLQQFHTSSPLNLQSTHPGFRSSHLTPTTALKYYNSKVLRLRSQRYTCNLRCNLVQTKAMDQVQEESKLKLYSYWGSSCCWRVLIALNSKGLDYQYKPVNLLKGEQFTEDFSNLNPIGYVPALVDGDIVVSDSLAILLYLEEKYPQHPLLPLDLQKKAINLQAANIVSSSIQPLQNHDVLDYIEEKVSPNEKVPWVQYHIQKGFAALEKLLMNYSGKYATGDEVYLADLFLAPQINVAMTRFGVNMTQFPLLSRLNEAYSELPVFKAAMPDRLPDYVKL